MTTTSWSALISTLMLAGGLSAPAANAPALDAPLVPAIADAIKLIVQEMRARCPGTKVLLLAVFSRNKLTDTPKQLATNRKVNEIIAKLDDGKNVRFLDINKVFLAPAGKVPRDIMPDFLHPNEHGYELWAEAMDPTLAQMMK